MSEDEYARPRHGYDSGPSAETRDLVELVIDAALFLLALASLTFTVFALLGFWTNK